MRMKNFTVIKMGQPNLTIGASLKIFQVVGRAISVEFCPSSTDLTALNLMQCITRNQKTERITGRN
jgi:hypothetical protein